MSCRPVLGPCLLISVAALFILAINTPAQSASPKQTRVPAQYSNLPLAFERNLGQTDARAKFVSRGPGYTVFVTATGVVFSLQTRPGSPPEASAKTGHDAVALRMNFVGANQAAAIEAMGALPGKSNYLIGDNPAQWHTNIPHYAKVRYRNLYPGIDLILYGNQRQLEYDLVVAPGADIKQVRFSFDGAEGMQVDDYGHLVLHTGAGDVLQSKPKIYQGHGRTRSIVPGRYSLSARNEISFELGAYDRRKPLVIDPVLSYSTFLGGSGSEEATGIAVDSSGRAYVAGSTTSINFPRTTGLTAQGNQDAFITKLNSMGTGVLYSTYLGGGSDEFGKDIDVDAAGHAYLTGSTASPDFPAVSLGTTGTIFVSKLNAAGSSLLYSVRFGANPDSDADFNGGYAIAVDSLGQAYVTGATTSNQFPVTPGAFQTTLADNGGLAGDAFISKLNAAGTRLLYSSYLGGNSADAGFALAVDPTGNAYVGGYAVSDNFPTTPGAFQPTMAGQDSNHSFVAKVNTTGTALLYSTYFGSDVHTVILALAIDSSGNAYVTGETSDTNFPITRGAYQTTCKPLPGQINCTTQAFVSKLNPTGSNVVYSTFIGGPEGSRGYGIAVSSKGSAYVVGAAWGNSGNFPTTRNAFQRVATRSTGFFAQFTTTGGGLVASSYLGGMSGQDIVNAVALGPGGAYVAGGTSSGNNFPVTKGAFQTRYKAGGRDAFVAKIIPLCSLNRKSPSVTICKPASRVKSPFDVIAGTTDTTKVNKLEVFLDGVPVYSAGLSAIAVRLSAPAGNHRMTVTATDTAGKSFWKTLYFTVVP